MFSSSADATKLHLRAVLAQRVSVATCRCCHVSRVPRPLCRLIAICRPRAQRHSAEGPCCGAGRPWDADSALSGCPVRRACLSRAPCPSRLLSCLPSRSPAHHLVCLLVCSPAVFAYGDITPSVVSNGTFVAQWLNLGPLMSAGNLVAVCACQKSCPVRSECPPGASCLRSADTCPVPGVVIACGARRFPPRR